MGRLRQNPMGLAIAAVLLLVIGVVAAVAKGGDDEADTATASSSTTVAAPSDTFLTTTSTTVPGTPPPVDNLNGFVPAPLQWSPCGGGFECASLSVPIDWAAPAGATIALSVSRQPATGGSPLGALATNPGGPGASGNGYIRSNPFADDLKERFDILSWDPRGVGDSAPLGCKGDAVASFLHLDSEPDDAAEQEALDEGAQAVAAACAEAAGELLPFVGTGAVARDLEAIRRAYGGPMAYYGFSYGTSIGLEHLKLFPGTMTHVVLDGVVDPTLALTDLLRGQVEAFQSSLDEMFAACPESDECPDDGAEAVYDSLAASLEDDPLPVGEEELGPSELATAAIFAAYDPSSWEYLYIGLKAAEDGDGSVLLAMAAGYRGVGAFDLYQAVSCIDSTNPVGSDGWGAFADELAALSPRLGATIANEMLPCAFWPVPPVPVTGPVVAQGSGPVLVIGTTGDPATPLSSSEAVASTLADGHLLVREGDGHTAYGDSECVQDAAADFLIDGVLPDEGARCDS